MSYLHSSTSNVSANGKNGILIFQRAISSKNIIYNASNIGILAAQGCGISNQFLIVLKDLRSSIIKDL